MTDNSTSDEDVDFKALFESAPDLYAVLDPHFNIISVNEIFSRVTMINRTEIMGKQIFEVFPDNPKDRKATGVKNLRYSLENVLKNKTPYSMAVQKYDIRQPKAEGGKFEERYWSTLISPILGNDHKVKYILIRTEDVTELIKLQKSHAEQLKFVESIKTQAGVMQNEIYQRAQDIQEVNKRLEHLSAALEISNKNLAELSVRDPLTGLFNRRYLEESLNREIDRANRKIVQLAVFMVDIDHFKKINDEFGHLSGDAVLRVVAECIQSHIRREDIASRFGGEEFVVSLFSISSDLALNRAEKLRRAVEGLWDKHTHLVPKKITISIGVALFPLHGPTGNALLKAADGALYLAKQQGRNQVVVSQNT